MIVWRQSNELSSGVFSLAQVIHIFSSHHFIPHHTINHDLTPQHKHSILLEYQPRSHDHSFAALAARHGIKGGGIVIQRWHQQWNGSAASLEEKHSTGRPRILSTQQVHQYVAPMIREKNRNAERVHYNNIHSAVEAKAHTHMLSAHQPRGKKRTADESQFTHAYHTR